MNFGKLFAESKGKPISYKEKTLLLADRFPVEDREKLRICIESTNSDRPQGLTIDITGSCEVQGKIYKKGKGIRMLFWEDAELIDPKNIEITVFTKIDHVLIYNIWEQTNQYIADGMRESKSVEYWHSGAAMIVEEIENGRRYHCNDGYPDEDFDDIIFTVQKLAQ
ncbi:MAG: hypothetical protein ACM3JI_00845 [Anaerolineae bacterium]